MKIELSQEQLNVIGQALQQLPYNVAKPLIDHIEKQKTGVGHAFAVKTPSGWDNHHIPCTHLVSDAKSCRNY
ncbi:hypothetical protein [Escherichia coli]|uniref:hypothetical protein n=1 Tax=Escherichia coli TaxID=562 RepID=UPI0037BEC380